MFLIVDYINYLSIQEFKRLDVLAINSVSVGSRISPLVNLLNISSLFLLHKPYPNLSLHRD
jgi:hypothetical protein